MRLRAKAGSTLIEMMITVAILSIASLIGIDSGGRLRQHSTVALQREKALQVLEYEAAAVASGRPVDAAVTKAMLEALPSARLESRASNGVRRFAVIWQTSRGETQREIFVLERPR